MTDKQIQASRENGSKSRGPVTPEGKQRSSQNALTHGLSSATTLLPGESEQEFHKMLVYWMRQLQPHTFVERAQAERVATAAWTLDRYPRIEASLLTLEIEEHAAEPQALGRAFRELSHNSRALDLLNRYRNRARRDYEHALKTYYELTERRRRELTDDLRSLNDEEFTAKWGINRDEHFTGYCNDGSDRLPNEPENPGIYTPSFLPAGLPAA